MPLIAKYNERNVMNYRMRKKTNNTNEFLCKGQSKVWAKRKFIIARYKIYLKPHSHKGILFDKVLLVTNFNSTVVFLAYIVVSELLLHEVMVRLGEEVGSSKYYIWGMKYSSQRTGCREFGGIPK